MAAVNRRVWYSGSVFSGCFMLIKVYVMEPLSVRWRWWGRVHWCEGAAVTVICCLLVIDWTGRWT